MNTNKNNGAYSFYLQLLDMYGRQNWWPAKTKFEVVVGAILTQQTSWQNVELAINNLRRKKLLNMKNLLNVETRTLQKCIYPTGFYKQKTKRVRQVTRYLFKKTKGNLNSFFKTSLENSRKELLGLFGVGKETADSILLYAGNKLILPIDAYTHRVIARVLNKKGDYDFIQSYLQVILPKQIDVYKEFHALIVEHAKRTCQTNPNCKICRIKSCKYRQ